MIFEAPATRFMSKQRSQIRVDPADARMNIIGLIKA